MGPGGPGRVVAVGAGWSGLPTRRIGSTTRSAGWCRMWGVPAHLARMSTALNTELMAERLWSIDDLAEFLGVSKSTVYDWRNRGDGPVAHRLGKHLKYARADVDAWLATRRDDAMVGGMR